MRKLSGYGPSLIVLVTAAIVLFAGPAAVRQLTFEQTRTQIIQATHNLASNDILERLNQAYRDIANVVEPSVVHVSAHQLMPDLAGRLTQNLSTGSGWVFDDLGHIVTNHHVIQDAQRIEVQMHDGSLREATHVGSDPLTDVAVIKIKPGRLHPALLGDDSAEPVKQGDQVFAFGSPFDFRFSMSAGVVSGKGRSVGVLRDANGSRAGYENFIQVDAAINPGNSGGPLTDVRGRVIGMNTAIATGRRSANTLDEGQFAGIGLAIPISMVKPVVMQIIEKGYVTKGYLGVHVADRENTHGDEFDQLGFPGFGVRVMSINAEHPAALAGLRNDDVIMLANTQPISAAAELMKAVSRPDGQQSIELTVWRFDAVEDRGRRVNISIPHGVASGWRGVTLANFTESLSTRFDSLQSPEPGVLVVRAEPGRPAASGGIRRDDLIIRVNSEPVATVEQLQSVVSSIMPGQIARLSVWRFDPQADRGSMMEIPVTLARLNDMQFGTLPADQSRDYIPELGIARMSTSTPDDAQRLGIANQRGVLLEELVPGSDLATKVPKGSIIIEVGDEPVANVDDFLRELRKYNLREHGATAHALTPDGQFRRVTLRFAPEMSSSDD